MPYIGNSINIAGNNRFLTSNLMLRISDYLLEDNNKDISKINSAINQLESNILALRQGGGNNVAEIELNQLPKEFLEDWNIIYQKWISLKSIITNSIIKSSEDEIANSNKSIDKGEETTIETESLSLIKSSNMLVTKLSNHVKSVLEYSSFIRQIFTILYIAVTAAFAFYIARRILKPILSLTSAILEASREKLNLRVKSKDYDDEL